MPIVKIRHKNQITLPARIARAANLAPDDILDVSYANGVIVLTPRPAPAQTTPFDVMSYAGIGQGLWGESAEDIDLHECVLDFV